MVTLHCGSLVVVVDGAVSGFSISAFPDCFTETSALLHPDKRGPPSTGQLPGAFPLSVGPIELTSLGITGHRVRGSNHCYQPPGASSSKGRLDWLVLLSIYTQPSNNNCNLAPRSLC